MRHQSAMRAQQRQQERGIALLLGLWTISVVLLTFIGSMSALLNQQVRTGFELLQRQALAYAHNGAEFAISQVNFRESQGYAGWIRNPDGTNPDKYRWIDARLLGPNGRLDVVDSRTRGSTIQVESVGSAGGIQRKVSFQIMRPGGAPGYADYAVYTRGERMILNISMLSSMLIDGYDSDVGPYVGPSSRLDPAYVKIGSDNGGPYRDNNWEWRSSASRWDAAEGVTANGPINLYTDVEVGSPSEKPPSASYAETPGAAIYDAASGAANALVNFYGTLRQDPRTAPPPFTTPDADPLESVAPGMSFDPSWGFGAGGPFHTWVVCPSDLPAERRFEQIYAQADATNSNVRLVLGCGSAEHPCGGADYDLGNGGKRPSCPVGDAGKEVVISTGSGTGVPLWITSTAATSAKIVVNTRSRIYINGKGSPPPGQPNVLIGSDGISNQVLKGSGAIDPAAVGLYHMKTDELINHYTTAKPVYAVVYGPSDLWKVMTTSSTAAFYGSFNARGFDTRTTTRFALHWDKALTRTIPGSGGWCDAPGGSRCKADQWNLSQ